MAVCECRSRVLSWYLRIGQCPFEIQLLSGWLPPSDGHGKRTSKTFRSEFQRQPRHLKKCLKVACTSPVGGRVNMKTFSEWRKQASLLTEALWDDVRPRLPKKQKNVTSEGRLLVLGDATVDESQQEVLRLGPKYCVEPQLDIVDRLALTSDVAR
ncbi:uncharacterized protein LOC144145347 [Haemaphysalis longicornis]